MQAKVIYLLERTWQFTIPHTKVPVWVDYTEDTAVIDIEFQLHRHSTLGHKGRSHSIPLHSNQHIITKDNLQDSSAIENSHPDKVINKQADIGDQKTLLCHGMKLL